MCMGVYVMCVLMPSCHWRREEEIRSPGEGGAGVGAKMQTCVFYNSSACSQPLCNLSSHACCSLKQYSTSLYFTHLDTPECVRTVENEGKFISGHSN